VKSTKDEHEPVQTAEYFKGKTVALFSVPGAFTPTCSAKHLPGFVEKAAALKAAGVDEIVCTAVNDPFVMGVWGTQSGSEDVTMLADGNGDFAEALGLTMDGTSFGLGKRGQHFALVVKDGVEDKGFVEAPSEFKDFQHGVDQIALSRSAFAAFSGSAAGALGASSFALGTVATNADQRLIYNPTNGALYYDADGSGSGAAIQIATLSNKTALDASDFVLI
jgi:peroxiredoxin